MITAKSYFDVATQRPTVPLREIKKNGKKQSAKDKTFTSKQ